MLIYCINESLVLIFILCFILGELKHVFDEYTNLHVSDVTFFPSELGRGYDFYASSANKNDVLYVNLESGKVEMIEGKYKLSMYSCKLVIKIYFQQKGICRFIKAVCKRSCLCDRMSGEYSRDYLGGFQIRDNHD